MLFLGVQPIKFCTGFRNALQFIMNSISYFHLCRCRHHHNRYMPVRHRPQKKHGSITGSIPSIYPCTLNPSAGFLLVATPIFQLSFQSVPLGWGKLK